MMSLNEVCLIIHNQINRVNILPQDLTQQYLDNYKILIITYQRHQIKQSISNQVQFLNNSKN